MATEIFDDIFDHGDGDNNAKRDRRQHTSVLLSDVREELQQDQKEEVPISQLRELKVQVLRQEG